MSVRSNGQILAPICDKLFGKRCSYFLLLKWKEWRILITKIKNVLLTIFFLIKTVEMRWLTFERAVNVE